MGLILHRTPWTQQPQCGAVRIGYPQGKPLFLLHPPSGICDALGGEITSVGTPTVFQRLDHLVASLSNANRFSSAKKVDTSAFTVVFVGTLNVPHASYSCHLFGQFAQNTALYTAAAFDWSIYEGAASDGVFFQVSNGSTNINTPGTSDVAWTSATHRQIAASFKNGVPKMCVKGLPVRTGSTLSGNAISSSYGIASGGYWSNMTTYDPGVRIALAYVINGYAADDAELESLANNPWQVIADEDIWIWVPEAGGAVTLAGNASATASATGAISTAVAVTGAAVGVVTASGTLSTAVPLDGVAAAVSNASGTMTIGVAIAGSALAQAEASAVMSIQVALAGDAIMQAAASGEMSVAGSGEMSGHAQMQAIASGTLSTTVPLAGAATITASAAGNLDAGVVLTGAAVSAAAANGELSITVILSGAAVAQAIAAGGMSIQVPLSGAAVMQASASGALSDVSVSLTQGAGRVGLLGRATQSGRRPSSLSSGRRACH